MTRALAALTFFALLLSACATPPAQTPAPASAPSATPTESPWQTGTPQPLLAPLTADCPGASPPFPPRQSHVAYGMNVFLFATDRERVLTLTDSTGVEWIRQQIHWRDLEGEAGQYVWKPLDQIVSAARSHHVKIMLSVVRSPAWATATTGGHSGMPDDPAQFARFLRAVATRYRGRVSAYEIWNEPNLAHESGGTPGDPATYLATLQAAYPAIKAADPCALVLAAPMAATNNADPAVATDDLPFYQELYALDNGAFLQAADAIALHPGAGPHPPDARWPADAPAQSHHYFRHIERVRDLMQQHNDPRQVWITEVGWTVTESHGAPAPVTEAQQADYLVDMLWYVRQHYPWVAGVLVWNLNFSVIAPPTDEKTTYSLLEPDWSIRPAFLSLQHNIPALRDLDRPPLLSDGADYRFAWNFPARGGIVSPPLLLPGGDVALVSNPGTLSVVAPDGRLRWYHHASGVVRSAPARDPNGTFYLGDSSSLLTAIHSNGAVTWTVRLESPVRGSPIYHQGHIYAVTEVGRVYAFDEQGQQVWVHHLQEETTPPALGSDGTLLVGTATGHIIKMDTAGREVWRTSTGAQLWAPLSPDRRGGVVLATVDGQILALDAAGTIRWRAAVGSSVVAAPLVGNDGRIYVAARDGSLTALAGNNGDMLWQTDTGSDLHAPPTLSDRTLYLGTEDERLLALDSSSGLVRWYAVVRGGIRAAPVLNAQQRLYLPTMGGRLYAFDALSSR